ncbi:MAG TPA: aminoacyl-tRNA deacylase [Acidisarcina sp.]
MSRAITAKTNGARFLDSLAIPYELRTYEVDLEDLTAISVAAKIGMPAEQVFKTLVCVTASQDHLFAVIPGDAELDFKKLAHAAGTRNVELIAVKEVQPLTGYIRGGVTIFGAKKSFPIYIDETIELFDLISASAGARGSQLVLSPIDYIRAAKATAETALADLTKSSAKPVQG